MGFVISCKDISNKSNNLVITSDKNQSLQNCKHLVNVWKPGLKEKG